MTVAVLDDYPVDRLPKELRDRVPGARRVRVVLEAEDPKPRKSLAEIFSDIQQMRQEGIIHPVTSEEAAARIRTLRDEWDD